VGDVTLPTPGEVEGMRERHVPDRAGLTTCGTCPQTWPCDAARLLALVDSLTEQHEYEYLRATSRTERLAAVLAECDRTEGYEHRRALTLGTLVDRIRRAATGEAT